MVESLAAAFGPDVEVIVGPAGKAPYTQDLGRLVTRTPRAVVKPAVADDVVAIVRRAAAERWPIAVRGSGHATHGQSLAEGLVLDLARLSDVHFGASTVTVGGGARWSVVDQAIARGLAFPVISDYLGLSIAGTLSSGGIGEMSFHQGTMTDHVVALDVVTGTGERVRCSRGELPELFDAVRAGMGQCAVIVGAELEAVPAPERMALHVLRFASAAALLAAQRKLADHGFTHLQGAVDPGAVGTIFSLSAAAPIDPQRPNGPAVPELEGRLKGPEAAVVSYRDLLHRIDDLEATMRARGVWERTHPWAFLALPLAHAPAFLGAVAPMFRRVEDGRALVYYLRRSVCRTPLFALPDGDECFLVGLLHNAFDPRPTLAANHALWKACAAVGGRVYPVGSIDPRAVDWRRHYGDERWTAFQAAKRRFDPAGMLAPGVGIFG